MESRYKVLVTPEAERLLRDLDPSVFQIIQNAVRRLRDSPELGKPLMGDLRGFFSWKVSRYRIVYHLNRPKGLIGIIGAGIRKEGDRRDIYNLLKRMKERGLLEKMICYLEEIG